MNKATYLTGLLICLLFSAEIIQAQDGVFRAAEEKQPSYHFDKNGIPRESLENYLERAITMVYFLMPGSIERNGTYPYYQDDIRMIKETGAKFIGRAIYRWGGESLLNSSEFWNDAKRLVNDMHAFDPDIVFQACLFEIITPDVNKVPIPAWVFNDFNLPIESRNFSYDAMLNEKGVMVNHWGKSSVPDISRTETKLWFYFLAGSYINIGCEAFHIGQVELIGMNDPQKEHWAATLAKIREYASKHARRNWVIIDAHVPYGGMVKDGISLIDFNSFPLRVKEIPEKPHEGKIEVNYLDGIYTKSKACTTPSGWNCRHLPYLVEFDNFGRSQTPDEATLDSHFIWGWDEISWFSLQEEQYRNNWIKYAYKQIKQIDPDGHLQMPGNRMITCPNETNGYYHANTRSEACPVGYSQEETIKEVWNNP
jgi:hypothetical protein